MKNLLFILLLLTITVFAHGQSVKETDRQAEVILKDGNVFRGLLLEDNDSLVKIKSELAGELSIKKSLILEIKYLQSKKSGQNQVYINLASRYFYSPSAINMKKGDGYYQNTMIILNSFNYAFTNYFTLGGGFEIISLLSKNPIFFITPKVSFKATTNLYLGAGLLYVHVPVKDGNSNFDVAFANITYGNPDHNLTVNIGSNLESGGAPVLTVNGFTRLGTKFGLMTENWIITGNNNYGFYTVGGRVIGRKNLFDFGLISNKDIANSGIFAIPFISYTLRI